MISTEDQLRAATRAAAATVPAGSAPPLRLPPGPAGRWSPRAWFRGDRARRRRLAALTPLAAAAAVIVVLAAAVAVAHGQPGHRAAAGAGHHESLPAQLPPDYVILRGNGAVGSATSAQVRATATGKVLATVRPPRPDTVFMPQVSGTADGREFVLLASRWKTKRESGIENWFTTASKLFLLRFDPYTHRPRLSALPIPAGVAGDARGFALSRSGLQLAVAWQRSQGRQANPEIQVFNLATGAVKTWTWPGGRPVSSGAPGVTQALSWANDGTLAFQQRDGFSADVRLLDTNGPGGSLKADSRLVLGWAGDAGFLRYQRDELLGFNVLLTPSGSRIICATTTITKHPFTSVLSFTEYSARTGRVVRQLGSWTLHGLWPAGNTQDVLWTNTSGSTLIVVGHPPGLKHVRVVSGNVAGWPQVISVLTPGKFVLLPGAPSAKTALRWPAW